MEKTQLSVIVPCYNESRRVRACAARLRMFKFQNQDLFDTELIFVDDGSNDKTLALLASEPDIKVISYMTNRGKGYAVRMGLLAATKPNQVLLDCDLSVRPGMLLSVGYLPEQYKEPTLLITRRTQTKKQPLHRRLLGLGYRYFIRTLFWWQYNDTQCPFVMLINVPKQFVCELKTDGFAYPVEILYRAIQNGYMVLETPADYINNPDSKVKPQHIFNMLKESFRIRFS